MGQKVSIEYSRGLKILGGSKVSDDGDDIALTGVNFRIEMAHFGLADFAGQIGQSTAKLGKFLERGIANDRDGVIWWKIMAIVIERNEVERVDETVGGIAGNNIDLAIDKGTINEAEVHDAGSGGEVKIIAIAPAAKTVGAFKKLIADADAPLGGDSGEIGHRAEMEAHGIIATDDHSEGVREAERLAEREMEAAGILLFDAIIDRNGGVIGRRSFVEHGG